MAEELADAFFQAARAALDLDEPIRLPASTILSIAGNPLEVVRFRSLARQINNEALRDLILVHLQDMRRAETRRGRAAGRWSDGIKYGVGGAGSATIITGVGAIIATGGAAAPLFAVGCGIAGLVIGVGGGTYFQFRKDRTTNAVEDIDVLIEALRR
jgi:hypothetical protein